MSSQRSAALYRRRRFCKVQCVGCYGLAVEKIERLINVHTTTLVRASDCVRRQKVWVSWDTSVLTSCTVVPVSMHHAMQS